MQDPAEANFCLNCGVRLANVCAQCQQALPSEAKFCMACGHALTATSQPASHVTPPTRDEAQHYPSSTSDAERRQLTVMFCDLVGSTPLSEQLDPKDLREVVRAYQQTCAEVIQRYDGYIAQLLGDALLVYFGWPQAHEDDAQRAVWTGLGMLDAMEALNTRLEREKSIRLAIRVGIHTGLVVVGEMGGGGHQEPLALGDTPNVASRLQGLAAPDTVVMSATTWRLVQGYFACDDLGFQPLKGVARPMQVYRVLGESGARSRLDVVTPRGLTPLVGREQEIGLLLERWECVQDGLGQVVVLSGEAGIGKSRLVQAMKQQVAGVPHASLECRCSPYHQNSALYPIVELWQHTLPWHADDALEVKLGTLEQTLRQYGLPVETTVSLLAPLLALPLPEERYARLNLTPQRQRHKTLETLLTMLLEQAMQHPVLFIMEDVHWVDPSTLEWLDLLLDQVPTTALLLLLTCRPAFQAPWGSHSYLTQLTIHRLSRQQIVQMVASMTGGKPLPAAVMQQVVSKTDGVPLFVEELTKTILESGLLTEAEDHYELTGPLPALAIPATLQDSLMARLDRLGTAKGVAQLGATIGRQFALALLQAVAPLDEATLQRELGRLVEAEILYQHGVPPQISYMFKHALIQEAAYQSLLRSTRQQVHQRIAQIMAAQFPDLAETQPELLAHHYTQSGLTEAAVRYWHQAGQRARERSAHPEAISHLKQGLALLTTLPDIPEHAQRELEMQISLGQELIVTKGYAAPEVEHAFTRARELCQQIGATHQLFLVLHGLWNFHNVRAELHLSHPLAEQQLRLAQRLQDPHTLLRGYNSLTATSFFLGEFATARAYGEQGIAAYTPQQHHSLDFNDPRVGGLSYTAIALWMLGYADQALHRSHEGLSLAKEISHPFAESFALFYATMLYQLRQEPSPTREHAETLIALSAEQEFTFMLASGTIFQGWALTVQGQRDAGLEQMRQGLTTYQDTGAKLITPYWHALLAEAYGKTGQIDAGLSELAEALAQVDSTAERFYEAELYRLKGELLRRAACSVRRAAWTPEACFRQAIEIARRQQAKSLELRAAMSLSRLWQRQGMQAEARQLLAESYGWFTEGFDTADLREARAWLDELA